MKLRVNKDDTIEIGIWLVVAFPLNALIFQETSYSNQLPLGHSSSDLQTKTLDSPVSVQCVVFGIFWPIPLGFTPPFLGNPGSAPIFPYKASNVFKLQSYFSSLPFGLLFKLQSYFSSLPFGLLFKL